MPVAMTMTDPITRSLELVTRAQTGDREALERLITRYRERVLKVVRLRMGRRLRECVESQDILQETFLTAVQKLDSFEMREEASLINWLARLAENQIRAKADYHSAKKRDHDRALGLDPASSANSSSTGPRFQVSDEGTRPLDQLTRNEEKRILEACLEELDDEYRELILLREYMGASWEAVAEETGRPSAAAARMKHAQAKIELGKLLRAHGIVDGRGN